MHSNESARLTGMTSDSVIRRVAPIGFSIGLLLAILSLFMLVPALLAVATTTAGAGEFGFTSLATLAIGLILFRGFRPVLHSMLPRQMFLLTTTVWVVVSAVAALPLVFVEHISVTDAFFETMSGITTTGSTVLVQLDQHAPAILLWRSILQWLGGIGFVVMGVAILPFLQVGGMRLFQTESSDWSEKAMPRARQVAGSIASVYIGLTLACLLLYVVFGMSLFDAINHALTTVSTGGYSTSDASFAQFHQASLHIVAIVFMLLGGLPFMLYVRHLRDQPLVIFRDEQVRAFLVFVLAASAFLAAWLSLTGQADAPRALLLATFNVVSVVTTTGFATDDYTTWGQLPVVAFFYLTFIGGCSGSTSGGMKIFRFQLAVRLLHSQLLQLAYPRRVVPNTYNGRVVGDDIMRSVVAFSFAFFATIGVLAMFLSSLGLDGVTSLSAAATAVTNVGPGLGEIVGPAGNFASLPDAAKWALSAGMLMGRLEVMTVLVLLTGGFWRG